jgi:ATP-dependent Zn protease
VWRARRFETHLLLDLPVAERRLALLIITDVPLAEDADRAGLADATEGSSFADLTRLARGAALVALRSNEIARSVTNDHVAIALRRFRQARPDLSA